MIGFDNILYPTSLAFSLGGIGYAISSPSSNTYGYQLIDLRLSRRGI